MLLLFLQSDHYKPSLFTLIQVVLRLCVGNTDRTDEHPALQTFSRLDWIMVLWTGFLPTCKQGTLKSLHLCLVVVVSPSIYLLGKTIASLHMAHVKRVASPRIRQAICAAHQELQVLVVRAPNEAFAMGLTVLRFVTNVVLPITLSKAVQERSN